MKRFLSLALVVAGLMGASCLKAQTAADLAGFVDGTPGAFFNVAFLGGPGVRPFLVNGPAGAGGVEGRLRALHTAMVALGGVGPVDAGSAGQPVIWWSAPRTLVQML
jgi:hypothetical protein